MPTAHMSEFLRQMSLGIEMEALRDHSDQQLVERVLAVGDEASLQAIINRHGIMVYRVCQRILNRPQDAEDAFQATFLVLAQKLRSLRKQASLASWLHGVAVKARAQASARRRRERQSSQPDFLPPDDLMWSELRSALDFELSQLPAKWRLPLILCYLEGKTQDESARQLRWSKSTLRRRLEEARDAHCRQRCPPFFCPIASPQLRPQLGLSIQHSRPRSISGLGNRQPWPCRPTSRI